MNVDELMAALAGEESGGNYDATNGRSGAHGKYQILPSNWPEWAREAGLPGDAPQTPTNQETVARFKLGQYLDQFGPAGAAVAWYAGPAAAAEYVKNPAAPRFSAKQGPTGKEPSINDYVQSTVGTGANTTGSTTTTGTAPATDVNAAGTTGLPKDAITPQSTPAQIEAYIYKYYSDVAPFLANKQIKQVLFDGARRNLTDSEIGHLLKQTQYYKTHSSSSRQLDLLIGSDPATAVEVIGKAKATISDILTQQGVQVDAAMLNMAAKSALRSGLISLQNGAAADPQGLQTLAINLYKNQIQGGTLGAPPAGKTDVTSDQLATIARSYFVPMTTADLQRAALDIQTGTTTLANFAHDMAQHSKSLFQGDPDIVSTIDAGNSPTDYFAPIKNTIANTLELGPDQVDLMSPQYQGVIQMYDPKMPGGGGKRAMTLGEAQQWARNQPGYKTTQAYQQADAQFGMQLAQAFGAIK